MRGKLIVLEGGEGSGKTTQTEILRLRMTSEGHGSLAVKEPGSTPLGEHLRAYLKSKSPLCPEAEILLFQAARAQLVNDLIEPALRTGIHVIADRFTGSTVAYQGYGRGLNQKDVEWLNRYGAKGLEPDLTLLLVVEDTGTVRERLAPVQRDMFAGETDARQDPGNERRFEDLSETFHQRVRRGYQEQLRKDPRWKTVDGAGSIPEVAEAVWEIVAREIATTQP